jgi:hypothetical protein
MLQLCEHAARCNYEKYLHVCLEKVRNWKASELAGHHTHGLILLEGSDGQDNQKQEM